MKLWITVLLAAVAGLAGCQKSANTSRPMAKERSRSENRVVVARVVGVSPLILGRNCLINQVLRLPDYPVISRKYQPGTRQPTNDRSRTWRSLVGPNPCGGPATVRYTHSDPDIYVENGWAYLDSGTGTSIVDSGSGPSIVTTQPAGGAGWGTARTKRVSATAQGTRFIVQEQDGVHRVIVLSSDSVKVTLDGTSTQSLTGPNTYFEVNASTTSLPAAASISPGAVADLVDYVEALAQDAIGS